MSRQLNRGEALHWLKKIIFFGRYTQMLGGEEDVLDQQFFCLNPVTDAVIVYDTVHIAKRAGELRAEGFAVGDDDLGRVWPLRHAHINSLGRYVFDVSMMQQG